MGKSRETFWKGANYRISGFRKPAKRRGSGVGACLQYVHSSITQTAAKLHIFGWVVGLIANLQLWCENIFKSNELLWKRFLLIVLTVEMLWHSLIQEPTCILLIYTPLYLYLSIYEQPCNEFDKKISEWCCGIVLLCLNYLWDYYDFHLYLNSLTEINMAWFSPWMFSVHSIGLWCIHKIVINLQFHSLREMWNENVSR